MPAGFENAGRGRGQGMRARREGKFNFHGSCKLNLEQRHLKIIPQIFEGFC